VTPQEGVSGGPSLGPLNEEHATEGPSSHSSLGSANHGRGLTWWQWAVASSLHGEGQGGYAKSPLHPFLGRPPRDESSLPEWKGGD
jgi:hypothetical protein